jgi:transposase
MWLLAGQKAPDHSTIGRFRTGYLLEACENLFYQYVRKLAEMKELGLETVFIDGTKLESCANKYTFVWRKSVGKWEEKMFIKISQVVDSINLEHLTCFAVGEENRTANLQKIVDFLESYNEENRVVFVYGRGKRKTKHQKYYEICRRFLDRQHLYDLHNSRFSGRNSYSKTDVDATFMRMKDDHMRNAQLKPGYNVQLAVDSEYIVAADIFQDRNDAWTLVPLLERMEEHLNYRYPSITADAGYESEEGYDFLSKRNQEAYIKPQIYERQKKRKFKQDISKRENMEYNSEDDYYICHNGQKLKPIYIKTQKSRSGYKSDVTVYEAEDCGSCSHKEHCTKAKGNKRLSVSKNFIKKRNQSQENITSEKGIQYRINRSIQVEGAFGVLKSDYKFQRFLLKSKTRVKIEILLLCLGYNLNKLHAKIQDERLQSYLFDLKSA